MAVRAELIRSTGDRLMGALGALGSLDNKSAPPSPTGPRRSESRGSVKATGHPC